MTQLPPLNGLRAFDVAGRHLNFRSAADELGVTQGAVAQQVRQLEAHLEMPLFERLPKGLAFTPAGRGFHTRIAAAFEDLRAATETLRPEPGKVLVSVTPTFAAKWLIPNLPDFVQRSTCKSSPLREFRAFMAMVSTWPFAKGSHNSALRSMQSVYSAKR